MGVVGGAISYGAMDADALDKITGELEAGGWKVSDDGKALFIT